MFLKHFWYRDKAGVWGHDSYYELELEARKASNKLKRATFCVITRISRKINLRTEVLKRRYLQDIKNVIYKSEVKGIIK
jgi:hypothetical protein